MDTQANERDTGLAVLWQLVCRARDAENADALGFVVVNESRALLDYRQSVLWLKHGGIKALSGLPAPVSDAPYVHWLESAFRVWSESDSSRRVDSSTLPQRLASEWEHWLPAHGALFALRGRSGVIGFWLLAQDGEWDDAPLALAQELAQSYAHAWQVYAPRQGPWDATKRWLSGGIGPKIVLAAVVVLALIPVRLSVLAPAEVVAKDPFVVRAPIEGIIDRFHVRPNTPVKTGQVLFELDTSAARARVNVARKALDAASEEYRQSAQLAVTEDEKSKLEMVTRQGRMAERAAELALTRQQLDRIQSRAQRDGVAVFSDAGDWIGKAVAPGERVMQIADPEKVEVVIRLAIGDAIELEPNADVTVYLTTAPQFSYDAALTYAAYRPELAPDGVLAYKLKADFREGTRLPRLGQTGTAKLHGERVVLIYYLLRRPIAAARQWLGI